MASSSLAPSPSPVTGEKKDEKSPRRTPSSPVKHITLTTHPAQFGVKPVPINWAAWNDPIARGPIIGTLTNPKVKNAIGTHQGEYAIYRAVAIAQGHMKADWKPDFTNTVPHITFGPYPTWSKIVSYDVWGAEVCRVFKTQMEQGLDIRPTIAVTRAHIEIPEFKEMIRQGKLQIDGEVMLPGGAINVTKAALDPVWYLPAIAERLGCREHDLRRTIFEQTGGMFPELITRYDLSVFLPPIGGVTAYIFGDPAAITDPNKKLAVRVHDECNGSDVFGSDICTCRPYLVHGVEVCVKTAQEGGAGIVIYNRKEGRALGEVVKYLVYNARKRQEGGDTAAAYFHRTKCVAGVEDARVQPLMPDALHWFGITKIDRFVSMSNDKYEAITNAGIEIVERIPIPEDMIPPDAHVEINAKVAKGYFTTGEVPDEEKLKQVQGRSYE